MTQKHVINFCESRIALLSLCLIRFVPRNLAAVLLQGSDTLTAALHTAVIFLARYPHVLKKAQEEVDRVVGADRMPTLTDMSNLPYVNAIMEEVSFSLPTSLRF